ncbi:hypothetical protein [Actinacidiphila sp. bgisy160]
MDEITEATETHVGVVAADGGESDSSSGNDHGGKGGQEDGGHSDSSGR